MGSIFTRVKYLYPLEVSLPVGSIFSHGKYHRWRSALLYADSADADTQTHAHTQDI